MNIYIHIDKHTQIPENKYPQHRLALSHDDDVCTGWRRPIRCLKFQVIFRKKCGKWPIKIRHRMSLRHPVSMICLYMYLQCTTQFSICTHMYIHINMPTYIHTQMNIYIHAYIHGCLSINAYIHTWIHTYIHTYIHRCLSIDTRNDGALCHVRVMYVNMIYLYICSQSINIFNLLIYTYINTYVHAQMLENKSQQHRHTLSNERDQLTHTVFMYIIYVYV